jgi:hypothetical protein
MFNHLFRKSEILPDNSKVSISKCVANFYINVIVLTINNKTKQKRIIRTYNVNDCFKLKKHITSKNYNQVSPSI